MDADLLRSYGYDEATIKSMAEALGEAYTPPGGGAAPAASGWGTASGYDSDGNYVGTQDPNAPTSPTAIWASKLGMTMDQVRQLTSTPQGQAQWNSMVTQAQDKEAHAEDGIGGIPLGLQNALTLGGLAYGASSLLAPSSAAAGATAAGTTGAAAAGAPTLAEIAASAPAAGESFVGPATGTVLEPGLQASGAVTYGVPEAAAGITSESLAPLAVGGAAGAAVGAAGGTAAGTAAAGAPAAASLTPLETAATTGGAAVAADKVVQGNDAAPTDGIQDVPPIAIPDLPASDLSAIQSAAGGAAGSSSALSRILDGTANNADWLSVLGTGAATGLGVYGANETANKLQSMYDTYLGLGAPSRTRYENSFAPGFKVTDIPGYQDTLDTTTDTLLRRASTGGNPATNPGVLAEISKYVTGNVGLPTLQNYRNQNAATGGYSAFNTAAPGTGAGAVNAAGSVYGDIGYGVGQITNPKPQYTLNDIFRTVSS